VIAVRVRDHGAVDRKPGIDVEVGGWTVQAAVGDAKHVVTESGPDDDEGRPGEQEA
jgi:hypothetical protein